MNIKSLHFLLTYQCNFECDHCFVWGGPKAEGVMTLSYIREIYEEAKKLGTVRRIYFEGGEPFLYFPIMIEGLREAKQRGFETGIVTNGYWATTLEDAIEWLRPIAEVGINDLTVSDDSFHFKNGDNRAKHAVRAARELGLPIGTISIQEPQKYFKEIERGTKPVGGAVMFRGRAAEKLVRNLPKKSWKEFRKCVDEDFLNQSRVHLDPFGYVHLCQGIAMGNVKTEPLSKLIQSFDVRAHPICSPILERGPVGLVEVYDIPHEDVYVDECHLCYSARLALRKRFPECLTPDQMYGASPDCE